MAAVAAGRYADQALCRVDVDLIVGVVVAGAVDVRLHLCRSTSTSDDQGGAQVQGAVEDHVHDHVCDHGNVHVYAIAEPTRGPSLAACGRDPILI